MEKASKVSAGYSVAVVKWSKVDGIATAIHSALLELGHRPVCFRFDQELPEKVDAVFTFAPYGKLLDIPRKIASLPEQDRPLYIHWDTEGIPNPRIPWAILKVLGTCLAWVDRQIDANGPVSRYISRMPYGPRLLQRGFRIHLDGLYHFIWQNGWCDIFAEPSQIYARINSQRGLPTLFAPWGTYSEWYEDLDLERDIDVLWIGSRRNQKRFKAITWLRKELAASGYHMHIIDGVENPKIYDHERNVIFNRSKITLNILPAWYFNSFAFRFHLAAGNRSLVISEPILPHNPCYQPGVHYISAPLEDFVETISFYLEHEEERRQITENAYQLVTTQMTFTQSIKPFMDKVSELKANSRGG